jgi:hypothetical protein
MRRASLHQELGYGVVLWLLVGGAIGNPSLWIAGVIVLAAAWVVTRPG